MNELRQKDLNINKRSWFTHLRHNFSNDKHMTQELNDKAFELSLNPCLP